MTTVRRSAREKRKASSYYEDAKKEIEERASLSPVKKRAPKSSSVDHESENDDSADEDTPQEDEEEDDQDESEEDEEEEAKPLPKKKVTPKKPKKVSVQVGSSTLHKKRTAAPRKPASRTTQSVLAGLAKKVLEQQEVPDNSLVAALLNSGKEKKSRPATETTTQLEGIARRIISIHMDNPNLAQIQLINLIFRVVGGTTESFLGDTVELEDLNSDEWATIITNLVDDMRYTAADQVLLCADPNGAVHAAREDESQEIAVTAASLGVREFRKIYEEFWFILVSVALAEGSEKTCRFEIEMVRDWIMRVNELIEVAQPDIRGAAVIASLQMSLGVLDCTVELGEKIDIASRQYNAANKGRKVSTKAEALKFHLDSLNRSQEDLEELVEGNFTAVFMNRYRDSNHHIRETNIQALSKMTLLRPDLYLSDKYLKYIGWTLSDKSACVRVASVQGLSAPFVAVRDKSKSGSQSRRSAKIDITAMTNVIRKFLPRLADCTIDVNVKVQEESMALFLLLDRANFLEDFEDDSLWEQINNRALASDTTPIARRDALYFIIDQLEAFDYNDEVTEMDNPSRNKKWAKDKNASLAQSSDKIAAKKLGTLADWVAHSLTDGPIPLDNIRVELTDYIVDSLRVMPEHQSLVTNWPAMMSAINECEVSSSIDLGEDAGKRGERAQIAKQRVLVRILARSVQTEIGAVASDFLIEDVDPDLAELEAEKLETKAIKKKTSKTGSTHESLSVTLLKNLPALLLNFKTDPHVLTSASSLPRFLLPSVISLPQHKNDFLGLIKNLGELFMLSGNQTVLQNIVESFAYLARGDHVRAQETLILLKNLGKELSDKLIALFSRGDYKIETKKSVKDRKKSRNSKGSALNIEQHEISDKADTEFAISVNLQRLSILSKRIDLVHLFGDDSDGEGNFMRPLRESIVEGIGKRLKARQVVVSEDDESPISIPEIWKDINSRSHDVVAESVKYSLDFLLCSLAWSLMKAQENDPIITADLDETMDEADDDEDETIDLEDHPIVKQRDQLVDFVCLCFEQFLQEVDDNDDLFSEEQIKFTDYVQTAAIQTAADLRQLLPKEWTEAASPLLRACAFTDDQALIGGSVRYLRSRELDLRDVEEQEIEDKGLVLDLLMPFCRSFVANWPQSNRREAGYVMAHIVGSGKASQQILTALSRIVKKIDPVHLLETHMACLRTSFDDWLNSEPEELESESPTDEEMAIFEEEEKAYRERFDLMVQQAQRLSQSLGVGKVEKQLQTPLLAFVREGIRYAFSTEMPNGEEPLLPGGRLTFLSLIGKYVVWTKKSTSFHEAVVQNVIDREEDLQVDPEFDQAHDDDLQALAAFRKIVGIKDKGAGMQAKSPRSIASTQRSGGESEEEGDSLTGQSPATTPSQEKRSWHSRGSSITSDINRSRTNTLSPLMEEDNSDGSDERSPRPTKRSKLAKARKSSVGSALTVATFEREGYNSPIEEEQSDASSRSE